MRVPRSIFSQLLRLALVLVLPLVAFIGWGIYQQFQNDRHDALRSLSQLRLLAERQVHAYLDSTHHRMERLAYRVNELQNTRGNIGEMLREFTALNQEYTDIMLVDGQGQLLAGVTSHPANPAESIVREEPYRTGIEAPDFFVSSFKMPETGRWAVLLSHPVFDTNTAGRRTGTLLLRLNLPALSRLLVYDPAESRTLLGVIDDHGVVIMRSFKAEDYIGQIAPRATELVASAGPAGKGSGELPGFDGKIRTFSTAALEGTPWVVTVSMPSDEVYRDAWRNLWRALGLVGIVLTLVVVLLLRRASVLARPLTALAAAARAQAAGQINATAPESGSAEIAETARAFNEMVALGRRSAQSLQESERRYRTVIDQTGQMIYELDVPTGRVTWFGATAIQQITGYLPEEINQGGLESWKERLHPADQSAAVARLQHCLITGEPCRAEYRMRHKDGNFRLIEEQGVVLRNEKGAFIRMVGCMNDITSRKQVEAALLRERALLRQIIDLVPHFIFAKDITGKFILANC